MTTMMMFVPALRLRLRCLLHIWMLLLLLLLLLLVSSPFPVKAVAATATTTTNNNEDSLSTLEPIKVVFCGFGRTGTHSLAAGLERLGYKTLHGETISIGSLSTHKAIGQAVIDQNVPELLKQTSLMGYNATLEIHGFFWRDIRKYYQEHGHNEVKYVFLFRDFDPWYESMVATLTTVGMMSSFPVNLIPLHRQIVQILGWGMAHSMNLSGGLEEILEIFQNPNTLKHRELRLQQYDQYMNDAKQVLDEDPTNAFLFHLKDGYPSLCKHLNIPKSDCPSSDDEPFPHLSERADIENNVYLLHIIAGIMYVLPFVFTYIVVKLIKFVRTKLSSSSSSKSTSKEKIKAKTT